MQTDSAKCQCEHTAHFFRGPGEGEARTPNGNPGHRFEQTFFKSFISTIKTEYGTFIVCGDCKNDCLLGVQKK